MAVTNNVLNAINVFSSTSVFNSNKGSVGANDLNFIKQTTAELATEGGGIIAQSLGTNGYVKFANGLILQWGTSTSETTKTFPIAFSSNCYSVLNIMNENSNRYENPYVLNVTTSSFKSGLSGVNYKMYWIAVGKQQLLHDVQWGYKAASATWTKVTFPVAYSNDCYSVVTMNYGHYGSSGSPSKDKSTTGFYTLQDYPVTWIATGKQQWGANIVSFSSAYQTISFSIAFTAIYSCIVSGGNYSNYTTETWKPDGQIKITNLSNTGFKTPYSGPKWYIAMGYQSTKK